MILTAADASSTEPWMTFEYISRAFVIPPAYLQNSLTITDSHYPHITIMQYARDNGVTDAAALTKVQEAIAEYFTSKSSPSSPLNQPSAP